MRNLAVAILGGLLSLYSSLSPASLVYTYQGPNFTDTIGSTFSATDSVSGTVAFVTTPTPGETGKSDVASFSFTTGPTTITSSTPASFTIFSFDFDGLLNITNWQVVLEANVLGGGAPEQISTWVSFPSLASPLDLGNVDDGVPNNANATINDSGSVLANGIWTQSVPEPTTFALLGLGLAGIGYKRRRKTTS